MPDSYGKRQKDTKKAKKFAAREERRAARKQQREDEAAGVARPAQDGDPEAPLTEREGGSEPAGDGGA